MRDNFFLKIITLFLVCAALLQVYISLYKKASFVDFYAYYGAAEVYLQNQSPYNKEFFSPYGNLNFLYPPASLLLLSPLTLFPEAVAKILFTLLSLAVFIISIYLSLELKKEKLSILHKILIIAFLVETLPLKVTLALGQINNFVLFFSVLSLYLLKSNKQVFSALSLAVAASLKLIPLGLLPFFIYWKRYKFVFLVVLSFLAFNFLTPHLFKDFVTILVPTYWSQSIGQISVENQSLSVLIYRLTGYAKSPILALFIFLVVYFLTMRKKDYVYTQATSILALSTLFIQNAWQHHFVLVFPFIAVYFSKFSYFLILWLFIAFPLSERFGSFVHLPILNSYLTVLVITLLIVYIRDYGKSLKLTKSKLG